MWPLACSSYSFIDQGLVDVLKKVRQIGFSLVDLGSPQVNIESTDFDRTREVVEKMGLHTCVLSANISYLTSGDQKQWYERGLLPLRRAVRGAYELGGQKIGLTINRFAPGASPRLALFQVVKALKCVETECEYYKVPICIEIHPHGPVSNLQEAKLVQKEMRSQWIGFTVDTSLMTWISTKPQDALFALKDFPLHIEIRDVTESDFFGLPGRGVVDFDAFFKVLKKINYSGSCVLELFKTEENFGLSLEKGLLEAKEYIESCMKHME